MVDLADALKAEPPRAVETRAREKKPVARKTFTMQRLRRLTLWGASAAGALLVAALASRSEVGVQRIAVVLHGGPTQLATRTFDAPAETQRLAEAVRGLNANDEEIKSRLAAVEHDMDDVTGAITKQIKAVDATRHSEDGPSVVATAALTASLDAPLVVPPAGFVSAPATTKPSADAVAPALPRIEYGVDIGSGLTIEALRARWLAIRSAHPQLFADLQPLVSVKEVPRANRIELRLVAGPLADAGAAAQLCAALTPAGLFCQPTMFDGQRLATR